MAIENPKVFLSYAWTDDDFRNRIIELATRLRGDGINALLDVWDLPDGGDKYAYMEKAVTDADIKKVLIICNKTYKEKADKRNGGVGQETTIIAPALFDDKSVEPKFLPILFEPCEDSSEIVPASLASKIYIDLSDQLNFENSYERLIRTIYGKPEFVKPVLGQAPDFVDGTDNQSSLSSLVAIRNRLNSIKSNTQQGKIKSIYFRYRDALIEIMSNFKISIPYEDSKGSIVAPIILEKWNQLLPLRNEYCNFLTVVMENDFANDIDFAGLFEQISNLFSVGKSEGKNVVFTEHYQNFLWELIIATVVYCSYYQNFKIIDSLVRHTYFLTPYADNLTIMEAKDISDLHINQEILQSYFKNQALEVRKETTYKFTYTSELILKREFSPILSKTSILWADITLYWLTSLQDSKKYPWFPITYIYNKDYSSYVKRFKSKSFCKSQLSLFGVNTIEDFKKLLEEHPLNRRIGYRDAMATANDIFSDLKIEEIGLLP